MKITLEFSSREELQQFLDSPDDFLSTGAAVEGAQMQATVTPAGNGATAGPQRGRGRPRGSTAAAQQPAAQPAPAPGAPTGLTLDQVRAGLMEVRNVDGNPDAVRNLVKTLGGVEQVADIPPEKFGAVLAGAQELMAQRRKANGSAAAPTQSFDI